MPPRGRQQEGGRRQAIRRRVCQQGGAWRQAIPATTAGIDPGPTIDRRRRRRHASEATPRLESR